MITKMIEIRDNATCVAALAIKMVPADAVEHAYLWRTGYPLEPQRAVTLLIRLSDQEAHSDPHGWTCVRTMSTAHVWLEEHFDKIAPGHVIDVRVVLGEATEPANAEIVV